MGNVSKVNESLRSLLQQRDAQRGNGPLLEAFVTRRDPQAFEALVGRYGPMVLGVCRRVLHNEADAEDAFQATFLVLVRKAASIRKRASVGSWLYGVACRTARQLKLREARRRRKEAEARTVQHDEPSAEELWRDLEPLVDRELERLPERYREAVVLCDLLGQTKREAAAQLHIPEGTLSSRLARARQRLRKRLAGAGAALTSGSLAAVLAEHPAVAATLLAQTVRSGLAVATGGSLASVVSERIAHVTQEVLGAMLLSKWKVVGVLCLALGLAGLVAARAVQAPDAQAGKQEPAPAVNRPAQPPAPADAVPAAVRFRMAGIPGLVRFSPSGKTLLAVSTKQLERWDLAAGRSLGKIDLGDQSRGYAAALSPDGKVLALGSVHGAIRRWEIGTGRPLQAFQLPALGAIKEIPPGGPDANAVGALAFSADGRMLAAVGWDRKLYLWEVATGRERAATWQQPDGAVATVLFSPDGRRVAVASDTWRTHLHDLQTGKVLSTLDGMPRAFMDDGKRLALWNHYGRLRLVDVGTGKEFLKVGDDAVRALAFSPDGKLLALVEGTQCALWSVEAGKRLRTLPAADQAVTALAFSPGGKLLAVASSDGTIQLIDPATGAAAKARAQGPGRAEPQLTLKVIGPARKLRLGEEVTLEVILSTDRDNSYEFLLGAFPQTFAIYLRGPAGAIAPDKILPQNWMHQEHSAAARIVITRGTPYRTTVKLSEYFPATDAAPFQAGVYQVNVKFYEAGLKMAAPLESGSVRFELAANK
jgi:RNA polymerase sigma factor (sigma-70 family)